MLRIVFSSFLVGIQNGNWLYSFSVLAFCWSCLVCFGSVGLFECGKINNMTTQTQDGPKSGKTGHIRYCLLIYRDPIDQTQTNNSRTNLSGADIGPRYSLSTLTIGNTNVRLLIYHYPTVHHLLNWSLPNFTLIPFFKIIFYLYHLLINLLPKPF
jgi:hypothetical protein